MSDGLPFPVNDELSATLAGQLQRISDLERRPNMARQSQFANPAGIARVHQVAHGFTVGTLVWPGPTFAAPTGANRNYNGGTPGIVFKVDGPDDFRVCFSGRIRIPGASYSPFQVYYLYNGALSPSAYNMPFAVPVALAISSDELVMGLARQQRDQLFTNIKTAHGFIVGTVLYWDTIGGDWIKADAAQSHDGIGVVVDVIDANTYQMQFDGCCYLPALASSPAIDFHFGGGVNAGVLYEGPGGGTGFAASGYASRSVLYHMGSGSCYLYGFTMRASHSHFLGILHDVGLSTLHDRDALSWSTSTGKWLNLPGLPAANADKQFPRWNSSLAKWESVLLGVSTMDDVVLTSIQDRDILEWDTTTSKWVNVRGLDQGTAVKQVLVWNTTTSKWEHSGIQVPFLDDTNIGTLHDRDVLAWSTATTKWVNLPGLPAATVDGQVPVWNATLSRWDAGTAVPDLGDMAYYPDPLTIGAGETGDSLGVMSPGQFVLSNSAPIAFTGDDISTAAGAMTFQAYLDQATDDLSARWYKSGASANPEMQFTYATGEFRFRYRVKIGGSGGSDDYVQAENGTVKARRSSTVYDYLSVNVITTTTTPPTGPGVKGQMHFIVY
jgi:hypothetical protein